MGLKDNYWTIAQAAEELGVTRQTIHRWIIEGKLPAEKIGRQTLIEKAAIFESKQRKFQSWISEMVSWNLAKDDFKLLREYYDFSHGEKLETLGSPESLQFLVTKPDGTREMLTVLTFMTGMDKKTMHLFTNITDIERVPYEPKQTRGKREK